MLTELYDAIFVTAVNNNYKCNIMSIGKAKRKCNSVLTQLLIKKSLCYQESAHTTFYTHSSIIKEVEGIPLVI